MGFCEEKEPTVGESMGSLPFTMEGGAGPIETGVIVGLGLPGTHPSFSSKGLEPEVAEAGYV